MVKRLMRWSCLAALAMLLAAPAMAGNGPPGNAQPEVRQLKAEMQQLREKMRAEKDKMDVTRRKLEGEREVLRVDREKMKELRDRLKVLTGKAQANPMSQGDAPAAPPAASPPATN